MTTANVKFWQDEGKGLAPRIDRAKKHFAQLGLEPVRCFVGDKDMHAQRYVGNKVHGVEVVQGFVTPGHIGLEVRPT